MQSDHFIVTHCIIDQHMYLSVCGVFYSQNSHQHVFGRYFDHPQGDARIQEYKCGWPCQHHCITAKIV